MLRDFPWPFSRKQAALALVTDSEDDNHPTTEYPYSYRYPSDCLAVRKILSSVRNDNRASRVSYDLMADEQGTLILTDREVAVFEYTTTDAKNPARWKPDFSFALSFRLAAYIAPMLGKGDPFKAGDRALTLWQRSGLKAKANHANEVQPDPEPADPLEASRW